MRRCLPATHVSQQRRFDFDAALLALIFAGQFAAVAVSAAHAIGGAGEPHVDGTAIVASAHGARAP